MFTDILTDHRNISGTDLSGATSFCSILSSNKKYVSIIRYLPTQIFGMIIYKLRLKPKEKRSKLAISSNVNSSSLNSRLIN